MGGSLNVKVNFVTRSLLLLDFRNKLKGPRSQTFSNLLSPLPLYEIYISKWIILWVQSVFAAFRRENLFGSFASCRICQSTSVTARDAIKAFLSLSSWNATWFVLLEETGRWSYKYTHCVFNFSQFIQLFWSTVIPRELIVCCLFSARTFGQAESNRVSLICFSRVEPSCTSDGPAPMYRPSSADVLWLQATGNRHLSPPKI